MAEEQRAEKGGSVEVPIEMSRFEFKIIEIDDKLRTSGAVGEGGTPGLGAPIHRLESVWHSSCEHNKQKIYLLIQNKTKNRSQSDLNWRRACGLDNNRVIMCRVYFSLKKRIKMNVYICQEFKCAECEAWWLRGWGRVLRGMKGSRSNPGGG